MKRCYDCGWFKKETAKLFTGTKTMWVCLDCWFKFEYQDFFTHVQTIGLWGRIP